MQIHDLNTKALTNPAYVAFDDGTDTYKADFKAEIDNAAADAVADADLTDNTVAFTSGDAVSPTAWTAVDVLTSGLAIKTLFNRISTMIKNVRWLYSKLGTTDISSIGNGTVTGALSTLNSNVMNSSAGSISVTVSGGTVQNNTVIKSGRSLNIFLTVVNASATANGNIGILPSDFTPQGPRVLMGYIIVNNTRIPMRFNVNAQGAITLSYSTTQTMTQVEIMGTIPL